MSEDTIRTSMRKIIADPDAPSGVRELALEVLRWKLREEEAACEVEASADDKVAV